jgi:hypothetical protein
MQRTCSVPECGKAHRAKGYCSSHYNHLVTPREKRHPKVTIPCAQCGEPCIKERGREKRYAALFCSLACRDQWRLATNSNPHPTAESRAKGHAARMTPRAVAARKLRKAARGTKGSRVGWTAGQCWRCGTQFISRIGNEPGRYCSDRCKQNQKASRGRARKRGVEREHYSRHAIFERDGWRCRICGKLTDRKVRFPHSTCPVIDHLIPLVDGGADTAANVATAHHLCNSTRSDRGAAQLQLF